MIVELSFRYEIDADTVEDWKESGEDVDDRAVELATDLLADWLIYGGQPVLGINAGIVES